MHTLIVGARGVGKSTLIRRVLEELNVSLCGFETKKEKNMEHPIYGDPVFIYEVGVPKQQTEENRIGYCKDRHPLMGKEIFDRYAKKLKNLPSDKDMILLDEIGFMESCSPEFCEAILALLDGDRPIIAAVKNKEFPFLEAVRSHPNCRCFVINSENRDELVEQVLEFTRQQLIKA